MAKSIGASFKSELDGDSYRAGILISIEWTGGTSYMWTGVGPLSWNGQTWQGLGDILKISGIAEEGDVIASGITLVLSGISSSNISNALNIQYGGKTSVYFCTFDSSDAIIGTPWLVFLGLTDVPTITEDGNSCEISVTVENHLISLEKPNELRYTDQEQQELFSGDKGFECVTELQMKKLHWGQ